VEGRGGGGGKSGTQGPNPNKTETPGLAGVPVASFFFFLAGQPQLERGRTLNSNWRWE